MTLGEEKLDIDLCDIPVGGRRNLRLASGPVQIDSSDGSISARISFPSAEQALPAQVKMSISIHGEHLWLDLPVDPVVILGELAEHWQSLLIDSYRFVIAFGNAYEPRISFRRVGLEMEIRRDQEIRTTTRVKFKDFLKIFDGIGQVLLNRLPQDSSVVSRWRNRLGSSIFDVRNFEARLLNRPREDIRRLGIEEPNDIRDLIFPDDLRMAARLAGSSIEIEELRVALNVIREFPPVSTTKIDQLSALIPDALKELFYEGKKPYVGGYLLASAVRKVLGSDEGPVDIEGLLRSYDVRIVDQYLAAEDIEAIAAWGDHGPVIVVNRSGRHSSSTNGRRATLAHELCHLLVDRNGALPVAEAQGTKVKVLHSVEMRANAFAAELLLPRDEAARALRNMPDTNGDQIELVVELLQSKFEVSRILALRQLDNYDGVAGGPTLSQKLEIQSKIAEGGVRAAIMAF